MTEIMRTRTADCPECCGTMRDGGFLHYTVLDGVSYCLGHIAFTDSNEVFEHPNADRFHEKIAIAEQTADQEFATRQAEVMDEIDNLILQETCAG